MKDNPFYLYLLGRIDKVAQFQDGITEEESENKELVKQVLFSMIYMTADKIAQEASRNDRFPAKVSKACVSLTYTDIYKITELLMVEPEVLDYV